MSRWCVWAEKTVSEKLTESPGRYYEFQVTGMMEGVFWGYEIAQAAQTLWDFVGLLIYKRMYENKQNTS